MRLDNLVKILWVSDIHFLDYYNEGSLGVEIDNYISRFVQEVREQHKQDCPIDYILLSGDLAMKGTSKDYKSFFTGFLKKLLDSFLEERSKLNISLPMVLTIPGNHDVNWFNTHFFREYLGEINPATNEFSDRLTYLFNKKEKFYDLFKDYIQFFKSFSSDPAYMSYREFFEINESRSLIPYDDYQENRLFGYIVDKKKRLVLFLLNSAWYSIGDNFNELLASKSMFQKDFLSSYEAFSDWSKKDPDLYKQLQDYFEGVNQAKPGGIVGPARISDLIPDEAQRVYKYLTDFLKTKDTISEYSKQVSGLNLMKTSSFEGILEKYNDYTFVSCMHHPLNWLEWGEQYATSSKTDSSSFNLDLILKSSDLFLSGHEHIPYVHSKFIRNKKTIHLKSGCFLGDYQEINLKTKDNWFSFLTIDTKKRILRFRPSCYKDGQWNTESTEQKESFSTRNIYLPLDREVEIIAMAKESRNEQLDSYILAAGLNTCEPDGDLQLVAEYKRVCKIYHLKGKKGSDLFIYATAADFYSQVNTEEFFIELDKIIDKEHANKMVIRFVLLDLFVDAALSKRYSDKEISRDLIRNVIFKRADLLFDDLRQKFFNRFEDNEDLIKKYLSKFRSIQLVNHIIPYWEFEVCWS